jgi:hypothetical protein
MKVLVAARTPYEAKRAREEMYDDLAEDLVYPLVERFGSGVREFHDAPVEDGRYDHWYGAPPDHPLLAFDVLGRVPGALSTTIDHDRLDPESRLPARCPQPSFERPLRKRRARS